MREREFGKIQVNRRTKGLKLPIYNTFCSCENLPPTPKIYGQSFADRWFRNLHTNAIVCHWRGSIRKHWETEQEWKLVLTKNSDLLKIKYNFHKICASSIMYDVDDDHGMTQSMQKMTILGESLGRWDFSLRPLKDTFVLRLSYAQ